MGANRRFTSAIIICQICTEVKIERFFLSVHSTMKSALSSMTSERERLKQCLDNDASSTTSPQVVDLKNALSAVGENTLTQTPSRRKLLAICRGFHFASDFHSSPMPFPPTPRTRGDASASLALGCLAALTPAYLFPLQSCACFCAIS